MWGSEREGKRGSYLRLRRVLLREARPGDSTSQARPAPATREPATSAILTSLCCTVVSCSLRSRTT